MTPDRIEQIGEQLRAKITSKFTASIFLAGFALTVLSGQVLLIWQQDNLPVLYPVSVGAMVAAVLLFVRAVMKLDELTMPKLFWSASIKSESDFPPHGALLNEHDLFQLQRRMIFFWYRLTLAATVLTGIGVMTMLVPLMAICCGTPNIDQRRFATFAAAVVGLMAAFLYARWTDCRLRKMHGSVHLID